MQIEIELYRESIHFVIRGIWQLLSDLWSWKVNSIASTQKQVDEKIDESVIPYLQYEQLVIPYCSTVPKLWGQQTDQIERI